MAQAYYLIEDSEVGIEKALAYGREVMEFTTQAHPDVRIERHALFTVEDARRLIGIAALAPVAGSEKLIVIAASRLFHEAQNALLKLFEEPPEGTTIVLIVPGEGNLLATLRSRLLPLPVSAHVGYGVSHMDSEDAGEFMGGSAAARAKVIAKLLDAAKSDDDEDKQEARAAALRFAEGLARIAYAAWRQKGGNAMKEFLSDLNCLIPVLNDRSAPLKPILEHILIVCP
jgi:hypothetical protein